jgi:hypothetical protein
MSSLRKRQNIGRKYTWFFYVAIPDAVIGVALQADCNEVGRRYSNSIFSPAHCKKRNTAARQGQSGHSRDAGMGPRPPAAMRGRPRPGDRSPAASSPAPACCWRWPVSWRSRTDAPRLASPPPASRGGGQQQQHAPSPCAEAVAAGHGRRRAGTRRAAAAIPPPAGAASARRPPATVRCRHAGSAPPPPSAPPGLQPGVDLFLGAAQAHAVLCPQQLDRLDDLATRQGLGDGG